jgi:phosphocarrier protein HPr
MPFALSPMPHIQKKLTIKNKSGLHARPAALFVQKANGFNSKITLTRDDEKVNGKSIMGILMLGAEYGCEIIIEAEGDDAHAALVELEKIVTADETL